MHGIGEHIEDSEVVLDDHDRPLLGEFADQVRGGHPLVDVKIGRDLVEEVEVGVPCQTGSDRHPLEFAAGEVPDCPVEDRPER